MSKIIDLIKKLKPKHFDDDKPGGKVIAKPEKPIKEPIPVPKDPTVKDK